MEAKTKAPVFVTRERKIDKFNGGDDKDVREWAETILSYVNNRFNTEQERAEFIFEHLEGAAKAEVKFRVTPSKAAAQEIIDVITEVFKDKDSVTQLQQKFFSRNQERGESIKDYAYKLMDLFGAIYTKHPNLYSDRDTLLKQKFADGIEDYNLRQEMRRLNAERPELRFWELRDKAIKWFEEELGSGKCSRVNEMATCEAATMGWKELYSKQQEQLEELTKMMVSLKDEIKKSSGTTQQGAQKYGGDYHRRRGNEGQYNPSERNYTSQPSNTVGGGANRRRNIICHYCKEPNHIAKNCLLKRGNTSGKSETNAHENQGN